MSLKICIRTVLFCFLVSLVTPVAAENCGNNRHAGDKKSCMAHTCIYCMLNVKDCKCGASGQDCTGDCSCESCKGDCSSKDCKGDSTCAQKQVQATPVNLEGPCGDCMGENGECKSPAPCAKCREKIQATKVKKSCKEDCQCPKCRRKAQAGKKAPPRITAAEPADFSNCTEGCHKFCTFRIVPLNSMMHLMLLKTFDRNHDGSLGKAEAASESDFLDLMVAQADTDGNGEYSITEKFNLMNQIRLKVGLTTLPGTRTHKGIRRAKARRIRLPHQGCTGGACH